MKWKGWLNIKIIKKKGRKEEIRNEKTEKNEKKEKKKRKKERKKALHKAFKT